MHLAKLAKERVVARQTREKRKGESKDGFAVNMANGKPKKRAKADLNSEKVLRPN